MTFRIVETMVERCPGLYCGRTPLNNTTFSDCWSCPRGSRVNESYICTPCERDLEKYDWLYLGFMTMLPLMIHWFSIDITAQNRRYFT